MATFQLFVGLILIGLAASVPGCSQVAEMRDAIIGETRKNSSLLPLLLRLGKYTDLGSISRGKKSEENSTWWRFCELQLKLFLLFFKAESKFLSSLPHEIDPR